MKGEKRKLTLDLIEEIKKYISNGLNNQDVCNLLGISVTIFYRWKNVGEELIEEAIKNETDVDDSILEVKLVHALKEAETNFKMFHINNVMRASKHDWKASAWMLERKFNDEYGRVDRTKVSTDDDSGIQIQIVNDVPNNDK